MFYRCDLGTIGKLNCDMFFKERKRLSMDLAQSKQDYMALCGTKTRQQARLSFVGPVNMGIKTSVSTQRNAKTERRPLIIKEIRQTEKTYVEELEALNKLYINPLKESNLLTSNEVNSVFSGIESILAFHQSVMLPNLEQREDVGKVFVEYSAYFKMYTAFLNCAESGKTLFQSLVLRNPSLQLIETTAKLSPEHRQMSLGAYLLLPIQRIPRYRMLIEDLIRHTEEQHGDYLCLQKGLNCIIEIALQMNAKQKSQQKKSKMLELQDRLGKQINILEPHREFLREGVLLLSHVVQIKETHLYSYTKNKNYLFLLFNDLVLVCSPALKLKHAVKLGPHMRPNLNEPYLRLVNDDAVLYVSSSNEESVESWINSVSDLIQ